jgi:hypothetical protein
VDAPVKPGYDGYGVASAPNVPAKPRRQASARAKARDTRAAHAQVFGRAHLRFPARHGPTRSGHPSSFCVDGAFASNVFAPYFFDVMAGLGPVTHVFFVTTATDKVVDGRAKPGHDD